MKTVLIGILLALTLAACNSTTFIPPKECEGDRSLLLQTIKDPQALSKGLMTINLLAMEKLDNYGPKDATAVLDQVEKMVAGTHMTYAELVGYLLDKLEVANALAGAAVFIVGEDISKLNMLVPITTCDRELVLKHIEKQRVLVAIYGAGK